MSASFIFNLHLLSGYVAWLVCSRASIFPKLRAMNIVDAQSAIAVLHSFRFFGLVFILPGVVGHNLPQGFAPFAAYGDFLTAIMAIGALLTVRIRPLFWLFVLAFNLTGTIDILVDYYHGVRLGLPAVSGELGSTYPIVIIYVPLLMITHVISFYLTFRQQSKTGGSVVRHAVAS